LSKKIRKLNFPLVLPVSEMKIFVVKSRIINLRFITEVYRFSILGRAYIYDLK